MKKSEIYRKLLENPRIIRFELLCRAAERFGIEKKGGRGGHRVFIRDGIPEILDFQNVHGRAKPYQVRQLCILIRKYSLLEEDDDV